MTTGEARNGRIKVEYKKAYITQSHKEHREKHRLLSDSFEHHLDGSK
jgi:hypothetical protein